MHGLCDFADKEVVGDGWERHYGDAADAADFVALDGGHVAVRIARINLPESPGMTAEPSASLPSTKPIFTRPAPSFFTTETVRSVPTKTPALMPRPISRGCQPASAAAVIITAVRSAFVRLLVLRVTASPFTSVKSKEGGRSDTSFDDFDGGGYFYHATEYARRRAKETSGFNRRCGQESVGSMAESAIIGFPLSIRVLWSPRHL